jgi:hypothetical protein
VYASAPAGGDGLLEIPAEVVAAEQMVKAMLRDAGFPEAPTDDGRLP